MTERSIYDEKPWISAYEADVPQTLDILTTTLPGFLDRAVSAFPDRTALNFQGFKLSYREFDDMTRRMAAVLKTFGVTKGDRVAILLPNVIPCVVSYYAILRVGGIVVMNNPLYSDRELLHQFNDSGAKVLITLDLLADRMVALRKRTHIEKIIHTSIGDYLPFPKSILFPLVGKKKGLAKDVAPARDVYAWKKLIAAAEPSPTDERLKFGDIAMYQYTGGTTGLSKGVKLSHGNLSSQVQQVAAWFPAFEKGKETAIGALPIFHVFGMTIAMNWPIMNGWEIVLVPKPEPDALLTAIKKFRPTIAALVPTMFIGILNHPAIGKADLTSIKGCFSGSAPLPVEVIRAFEEKTGAVIVEGFGLTEASPVTHINPFSPTNRKVGSIGIPIPGTSCRIVELTDKNRDAAVGSPGELLVKGPQVMGGYLGMPEETTHALRDGWLYTGDVATMDEDGFFFIVDRIKDMIISGGYNVYPREIDEVIYEHPKVSEACAVGIPHPSRGEQVKLFVVLKAGETATSDEIIAFCAERMAKYKLPTMVEFRDELPKTNIGKILRKVLRDEERAKG
jgi:long-chain acyl-CoA synthetase